MLGPRRLGIGSSERQMELSDHELLYNFTLLVGPWWHQNSGFWCKSWLENFGCTGGYEMCGGPYPVENKNDQWLGGREWPWLYYCFRQTVL